MIDKIFRRNGRKFTLRTALVVAFTLQIVAAVGSVGYISFMGGQRAVNNLSSQLRRELTARIERELRAYFETPHELNRLNTAAFFRGELDVVNGQHGEAQLYQQMRIAPNIAFVYCGSNHKGEFFGVLRDPDTGILQLSYSNASTNFLRQYYRLDANGDRTYLMHQTDTVYDSRLRPWYRSALSRQGYAWTDIYIAYTTELPNITASFPVYDESGRQLLGVCGTDVVLPEEFRNFLKNLEIGKTGKAFVVDRQGTLISNSIDEPLMRGKGDSATSLLAIESRDRLVRSTAQHLIEQFGSFDRIQNAQQLVFDLNGQRQFLEVVPFQDGFGLDWLIVVTVPEADFMEQIYISTRNTILLALAALGVAIGVGVLVARWITRPVIDLTVASEAMTQIDLNQQVEENSSILELETLARSFNSMAEQLKESFATLEDKVQERTAELAQANQEISSLNQKLKAENLRMGAELEVARQIQKMILPKTEELESVPGLDIAGFMEPADEVGGDYYDVLQTDGIVTLGIGDVTGHGLESGLLMLMTQTAVLTLKEIKEHDPVRFLDTLNRTIYHNVQRMNSDKNLTLAILNYSEGRVSISGQHEETLVVRAGGRIERIDTMDLGLPIGLDDDIADFIDRTFVELLPGDGVVLYTDGIPEAYNLDKQHYGMHRLCNVISQNWQQSAREIKQAIVNDLRNFIGKQKVFDDITLLVFKQQ